ncbi:uncharacterized protein LOC124283699 isoform X2 [Haliotis rubra]|uniref:uncharacterized protein LOC124283699 isoform X2 n=1 Tax=Haliotis rubra TaxID=36100 RepID=UPI001EE60F37|nr:uncharacterized protein LOC124283699 isoform X2 [Haliotis rubra]
MKNAVHVILTFLTLWMILCDVTSVFLWHRELSSVKGVCDAQCEALCQEQPDPADKCEDLCRPSTRRQWIINCTDGGDCRGAGYCSVLKNISQGGYLPPKPDVKILRDPVTRNIMLHWTLDTTTQHKIIYIVQWDLALHPETLFNVPPLPSQSPRELKSISWYTQGWTISDTYLVNEETDVCVRPMFRVAAVSRFGSRWFTDPIKTPAIAPVEVRNITHSPFVYDAKTEEIKFVLYWQEPEGWNNSEIIMYSWTKNLDQPCSNSGQSVPVFFDSQTSTHHSNSLNVRMPKGGMGCKFKFQVRAFSRCTPNAVGPYSCININIDCNNVIGFSCPKTPIYNPPGNVVNITMMVVPIQRGYRVLMGWRPPTDKGSIGQIDQYHLRWGKLNLSTYDPLIGLGTLYNTSTKTVPGNNTWAEIQFANSTQNTSDTYGVQIIATPPGHSLVGSWLSPVTSMSPWPIGDDDAPPAITTKIELPEYATVLKDDDGVVIVLVPKARGAKVYVAMPEERSRTNLKGFSLQWGLVHNSTDKPAFVNKNTTFITRNTTSLVLDHLIPNRCYGVQDYGLGNNSNIDLEPEEEPELDVHFFTMPLIQDPVAASADGRKEDPHGGNKNVLVAVSVTVLVVAAIVVVLAVVGRIVYKKRRKKLPHLQQRHGHDSDAYSFYYDLGGRTRAEISSLASPPVVADRWELPHSCLKLGQVLGSGAFGLVLKGKVTYAMLHHRGAQLPRTEGQDRIHVTVAVKMLQEDVGGRYYRDFIKEINLMKRIGYHANVVSMLGCCTLRQPICLVVEHMANGDLLHYLKKIRHSLRVQEEETGHYENREVEHITPLDLLSFARQIARGMEFLSGKSFVHRDLAARNILVDDNKVLKIGDFGLTRFIYDDKIYVNRHGGKLPVKWMSVEAIFDLTFSTASDVWSFGIVLFEIVTLGGTPYPGVANRELLSKLHAGYRMERPDNCSTEMYQLMRDCWKSDPKKRPSFSEIGERIDTMIAECSGQEYLDLQLDECQGYYQVQNSDEEESDGELRMDIHDVPGGGNELQEEDGEEETSENRAKETDGTLTAEVKKLDEEIEQDHHDRDANEGQLWATSSPVMCDRLRVAVSHPEDEEFLTIPKFISELGSFKSERSRGGSRKDDRKIPAKLQLMEKLHEAGRREDRESDSSLSPLSDEVFSDGLYTAPYSYLQTPDHDCLPDSDTSPTNSEISDNVFNTDSNEMSHQCHRRYERTTSEISTTSIDSGFPQSPLQTDFPGYSPKTGYSLGYSRSRLNSLGHYCNRLDSLGYTRSKIDFGYSPRYKQKYSKNASRSPQLVSSLGQLRRLTRHTSMSSGGMSSFCCRP